jgi:Thioredoxin-like domain
MVRFLLFCLVVSGAAFCAGAHAALDDESHAATHSEFELVVIETKACIYCTLFRRDVAPAYLASPLGKSVPMRFSYAADVEQSAVQLARPIDTVPTVLILKNGRETARIAGYAGRRNFMQWLRSLLGRGE